MSCVLYNAFQTYWFGWRNYVMDTMVDIKIPMKIYNDICLNCDDPDRFCQDAVKRFIDCYPVD